MSLLLVLIISIFIILEFSNVLALYFKPGTTKANSVGVFSAWEKSKDDPEIHAFVKYLVYWVAGTKLIFISLLIVILAFGDPITQSFALLAMIFTTLTFFWRLFPLIRKMDKDSQLTKKNYSRTLGIMILVIVLMFVFVYLNEYFMWIVI
ncbi:MAG: hypothetical protein ACW98Y_19560 [Candidatus Thorarchaeota archaeon]|jgi:hypothetical protein